MRGMSTLCPRPIPHGQDLLMPMLGSVERGSPRAQGNLMQRVQQETDKENVHNGCNRANAREATLALGSIPTQVRTKMLTLKEEKVNEVVLTAQVKVKVKVKAKRSLSQHRPPEYRSRETLKVHHLPTNLTDFPVIST